jgi:Periplasmic protein TonB, links inner and outer membranes
MEELIMLLVAVLFNPITWIIVVVILLIRSDNKKKHAAQIAAQNQATAGEDGEFKNNVAPPPPPPKPKDPMAKWNWLLYIGSFLIIMAMVYFIDSVNDAAVAPTTIILTLLIFCAGLGIYKAVDYLRPVGKAFTYSALCMIPLWLISLSAIKVPGEVIPLIVSIVFTIASFISALMLNDQFLGYVAMLSPIALTWSFQPLMGKVDFGTYLYFLFIAPLIASIAPLALWATKPKWLPVAFRHASMGLGLVLIPLTVGASLGLYIFPDAGTNAPFLRTICAVAFLIYTIVNLSASKKHGFFVAARFAAQLLVTAVLWDCLNFSLISFRKVTDYTAALVCAIVWLLTFLAQVVYSLYAKVDNAKDASLERVVGLISILGIFSTPLLCSGFAKVPYAIVWIVICLVTAVLGVLHAMKHKNVTWSLATVASILIAPLIFGNNIAVPAWGSVSYLVIYSVIGVVFLLGYYYLQKIQKKESDTVGVIAMCITAFIVLICSFDLSLSGLGFLIATVYSLAFAFLSKINGFYEAAIYLGAMSLFSFSGNIMDLVAGKPSTSRYAGASYYDTYSSELSTILAVIRAHIILVAFFVSSWLYEREKAPNQQARQIIGFSFFSLYMSFACLASSELAWGIIFLIEQVAALLYSVTTHRNWMTWFSSIEVFIITLRLTGGPSYIWLGIIGIGLIAFVMYQLRKTRNKMLREKNLDPVAPAQAEVLPAETPVEKEPELAEEPKEEPKPEEPEAEHKEEKAESDASEKSEDKPAESEDKPKDE